MEKETYWSRFAGDYEDRVSYIVGTETVEAIKRALSQQEPLGKTLELACGNGTYSEILLHKSEHLTATDYSDEMVAVSRERLKCHSNARIEKADCLDLDYEKSSFDTVVMINLLHIIDQPEKAVSEGLRVLKTNGRLIVVSFTTEGMTIPAKLGMIYRYLKSFGKPPATGQKLTIQKTKNILSDCGFKIEEAKLIGNKSKALFIKAIANN